jgi:hypothetical protein
VETVYPDALVLSVVEGDDVKVVQTSQQIIFSRSRRRMTVHEAVDTLERDGFVETVQWIMVFTKVHLGL